MFPLNQSDFETELTSSALRLICWQGQLVRECARCLLLIFRGLLFCIAIFFNPCHAQNASIQADNANAYLKALTVFAQNGNSLSSFMDAFDSELLLLHRPGIITLPGPRAVGIFVTKPSALSDSTQGGYDFGIWDGRIVYMPITFKEYCFELTDLLKRLADLGWLVPKSFTVYGVPGVHPGASEGWEIVWHADRELGISFENRKCVKHLTMGWSKFTHKQIDNPSK
jgi:hypothetical protein